MHFSKRLYPSALLLSLLMGGVARAQSISIVSGDGQVATQNNAANSPMVVVVKNAQGQPLAGTPVTWTLNGQGALFGSTTTTDANGQSSNSFLGANLTLLGVSFSQSVVTASAAGSSVSFTQTTSALDPSAALASLVQSAVISAGSVVSGPAGSVGATPVQVQVFAGGPGAGPVPNVLVRLLPVNATSGPQIACSGNSGYTNGSGIANCLPIFSGPTGTSQYIIDVGYGYRQHGPFTFIVQPGTVSSFRITGGNNQSGTPGSAVPFPLTAQVLDGAGNPLPNVPVTWAAVVPGTVSINGASSASDASGNVTASVTLGNIIGPAQVRLSSPQGGSPVVFNLQVNIMITGINKIAGDNQDAAINANYAQPLVIQVNSSQGPAAGVQVQFVSTGSTQVFFPNGATATTGGNGQATMAVQAGANAGTAVVTASISGFSTTFTLTIHPPGPAITSSSFSNFAGGLAGGVSPASLVTITGAGIATGLQGCISGNQEFGPLQILVQSVTVLFTEGSFASYAPIFAVCKDPASGQESVTVQVPAELPLGAASVTVRAGTGTKTVDGVAVTQFSPGVFEVVMSDGKKRALLQHADDGSFVSLESPARAGETLRAYVDGLGRPVSASGLQIGTNQTGIPGDDASPLVPLVIGVADAGVDVISAKYGTEVIGVYVVTFMAPVDAPSGKDANFGIAVNLNGNLVFSNASKIPIQ